MSDSHDELKADPKPAEGDVADAGGGGKSKLKKIILFAVLPLLILGGGGAAAYFTGLLDGVLGKEKIACENVVEGDENYEHCAELAAAGGADASAMGVFFEIPDMIVNLNATSKQPRFLKISLKVELEKAADQAKFEQVMPRVVDQFQTYLRELRIEDLRGSSGMYRMKIELLNRVKAAAPSIKVRDILFQEILVQ